MSGFVLYMLIVVFSAFVFVVIPPYAWPAIAPLGTWVFMVVVTAAAIKLSGFGTTFLEYHRRRLEKGKKSEEQTQTRE